MSLKKLVLYKTSLWLASCRRLYISLYARYWMIKGILPIEIKNHIGIGARLIWCLEILLFCEEKKLQPIFKFSYKDSNEEEDMFGSFFQIPQMKMRKIKFIKIKHPSDLCLKKNYNNALNLTTGSRLMKDNIIPREEITNEVDNFNKCFLSRDKTLGVHYRNSDKGSEAPFVSYENVLQTIKRILKKHPEFQKIFIATDDALFINFMKESELASKVVYRKDSFRSSDGTGIHNRTDLNRHHINRDAIVNMLILAKCSFIIKTASFLSSCSLLFAPSIPFIMLNIPYQKKLWFPESELIKIALPNPIN